MLALTLASKPGRTGAPRAGFTLIELLISSAIMAVILGAVGMAFLRGKDNFRQGVTASVLEARGRRVLDRIVSELQGAQASTLNPDPQPPLGSSTLSFRSCLGYNGTATLWGTTTSIQFLPDPRDPVDGIDNDGDGMIDEGRVVLTRDVGGPNQIQVTIAKNVSRLLQGETANGADDNGNGLRDEAGLSFAIDGDRTLTIRLSLGERGPTGRVMVRTVQTAVHMRN